MGLLIESVREFLIEKRFEDRLANTPPGSLRDDMVMAIQRNE